MPWWSNLEPREPVSVVLLQVDLAGHSRWMENQPTAYVGAKNRAEFAVLLTYRLESLGFDRLYWAGDGGVFARRYRTYQDAEMVCEAAAQAFDWFYRWRQPDWQIDLRASAALIDHVLVDLDHGNWSSPTMNTFLKHERDLALSDRFVVTDELRRSMGSEYGPHSYFLPTPRIVFLTEGISIVTWIDRRFFESRDLVVKQVGERLIEPNREVGSSSGLSGKRSDELTQEESMGGLNHVPEISRRYSEYK